MERWVRSIYQPGTPLGEDGKRVTASKEHINLSKEAAREGMVLLKNEGSCLPLKAGSRVALFGKGTFDYVKGGGGSGDVTVSYIRNLYQGLKALGERVHIYEDLADYYRKDVEAKYAQGKVPGMITEPEVPEDLLKKARAYTDTAIISISRFSGEGWDRKSSYDKQVTTVEDFSGMSDKATELFERGDFYLTDAENTMVEKVTAAFDKVIVVLNVGGTMDAKWFKNNDSIQSVLLSWQGGMEGGLAAAELLTGMATPCGKLADTFVGMLEDYPSSEQFHASDDYVEYHDDIYVGYRYFETIPGKKELVMYPFGYGLSYTEFKLSGETVAPKKDGFSISVEVTNTGAYAGKEVVQVYVKAPQGKLGKPEKVLAAFGKTKLLAPGESQMVNLFCTGYQFASYDDLGKVAKSAYVLEKGDYEFYIGTSVRDALKSEYVYTVSEDIVVETLSPKMVPTQLSKRMLSDGSFEELPLGTPNDPNSNILQRMTEDEMEGFCPDVPERPGFKTWGNVKKVYRLINVAEGTVSMEEFMAQLTDREMAELLGGQPNVGLSDTYGFGNLPKYGIPTVMTDDGPAGLRIQPNRGVCTTAWPCATLLACTWDQELVEKVGAAGGLEVKENNIAIWLTPAVNIHRSPLCGRNFEYYSEDPFLAGKMAAAMVRGIQSNRVGTSVKHFALNNKETNRKNSDSRASERAIREIYLKAFEIIVKEAQPWTIMSSYNIINGHRASENKELLEDILRGEWGFDGVVTTDWWTRGEHYKELRAGNDIKMAKGYPDRLMAALEAGEITRADLERGVRRLLNLILKVE